MKKRNFVGDIEICSICGTIFCHIMKDDKQAYFLQSLTKGTFHAPDIPVKSCPPFIASKKPSGNFGAVQCKFSDSPQ